MAKFIPGKLYYVKESGSFYTLTSDVKVVAHIKSGDLVMYLETMIIEKPGETVTWYKAIHKELVGWLCSPLMRSRHAPER